MGDILEVTERIILPGATTGAPTFWAEPGDLCIVTSIYPTSRYSPRNEDAHIICLGGHRSLTIDARHYKENFRKLEDFPRTLKEIRKYQRGLFGMRKYKDKT